MQKMKPYNRVRLVKCVRQIWTHWAVYVSYLFRHKIECVDLLILRMCVFVFNKLQTTVCIPLSIAFSSLFELWQFDGQSDNRDNINTHDTNEQQSQYHHSATVFYWIQSNRYRETFNGKSHIPQHSPYRTLKEFWLHFKFAYFHIINVQCGVCLCSCTLVIHTILNGWTVNYGPYVI